MAVEASSDYIGSSVETNKTGGWARAVQTPEETTQMPASLMTGGGGDETVLRLTLTCLDDGNTSCGGAWQ